MAVRAKFRYVSYQATHMTRPLLDEKNQPIKAGDGASQYQYETIEARTMTFAPVYGGSDANAENKLFWQATPSGKLEMQMVNPEAWSQFEMGKCYYLDFSPAPE